MWQRAIRNKTKPYRTRLQWFSRSIYQNDWGSCFKMDIVRIYSEPTYCLVTINSEKRKNSCFLSSTSSFWFHLSAWYLVASQRKLVLIVASQILYMPNISTGRKREVQTSPMNFVTSGFYLKDIGRVVQNFRTGAQEWSQYIKNVRCMLMSFSVWGGHNPTHTAYSIWALSLRWVTVSKVSGGLRSLPASHCVLG